MSAHTPRWQGIIRGFKTNGRDPWQVSIEMPEGPGIFNGTGPTVSFERGQRVHVLTDEGLAEIERAAAEVAYARGRLDERHDCERYGEYERGEITGSQLRDNLRQLYPYRRNEGGTR